MRCVCFNGRGEKRDFCSSILGAGKFRQLELPAGASMKGGWCLGKWAVLPIVIIAKALNFHGEKKKSTNFKLFRIVHCVTRNLRFTT